MLQRSIWSSLVLSLAVATTGLMGGSAAYAQAAPEVDPKFVKLADDVLHYSLVNNKEMAKASADAILDGSLTPTQVLRAFELGAQGRNFREVLVQGLQRGDTNEKLNLKPSAQKLLDAVDQGFRDVARDPKRISQDIERLPQGPRPYMNAKDRLTAAGQFAVPIYLEYLQKNEKKEFRHSIFQVMTEIGRPLLDPLIEELRVADPTLRVELIDVIGKIGYPQALPALRALQADESAPAQVKAAATAAIAMIDRSGRAASMSASELYLAGGENYYSLKSSYMPQHPDEKTNPVWVFDANLNNVLPMAVPTAIWNDVMAMRMAESALKSDANNAGAVSLWVAANLKRELELPDGIKDPSRAAGVPTADFFAKAAGPVYMNPVLARALDDKDSSLALRAITALEATGGVSGLVASAEAPLVRALAHPDRAVRFGAAFTLARANPMTQYPSFYRVVPILSEAVSSTAAPAALLVVGDTDVRNAQTDALRGSDAHYVVYAGDTIVSALDHARRAPAIDVAIIPEGPSVERIIEIGRTDYRLTGVPVLVTGATAELPALRIKYGRQKGIAVIDNRSDETAISTALAKARADIGVAPIGAEAANGMALTSLRLLDTLASDHRSIYSVSDAIPTLVEALRDSRPQVVTAAAGVIGKLNSPEAQRALAASALRGDADPALRIVFFQQLAESAKRTGNSLDGSQVNSLIKIVTADADANVRVAAAVALGALNVPSNQASSLILQQAR